MSTQQALSQPAEPSRIQMLRWRIIDAPQEVCIERARCLTESMRLHWDKPPLTRMSLALEHILRNISVIIRENEVIVGCRTSKLKGAPLFPENKSLWIEGDLENFDRRALQRALITQAEKDELATRILPFWKGKTVEEQMQRSMPEDILTDMDKYIFTMMLEITYGIGHFTMNHDKILEGGLSSVIGEAGQKLAGLSAEDQKGEKGLFYEAVIRSCRAVIAFAHRYSERALAMAAAESDPGRKAELQEMARVCARVPEHPAETFHEAVQSLYFIHLVSQIESGGNSISLGRIDQILYPYYRRDAEAGRITQAQARELTAMLFVKVNEIWNVLEEAFIPGGEGTPQIRSVIDEELRNALDLFSPALRAEREDLIGPEGLHEIHNARIVSRKTEVSNLAKLRLGERTMLIGRDQCESLFVSGVLDHLNVGLLSDCDIALF